MPRAPKQKKISINNFKITKFRLTLKLLLLFNIIIYIINYYYLPEMSSSSLIRSLSINGGSLFEKKSFKAVATAFTGISNECMSTFPSVIIKKI